MYNSYICNIYNIHSLSYLQYEYMKFVLLYKSKAQQLLFMTYYCQHLYLFGFCFYVIEVHKHSLEWYKHLSVLGSDLIPKFEVFVQLLTMCMSCAKLIDYTITDINKRKVKDIMVTMATQLTKLIDMCPHSKDKKVLL